jgi:hypothetical protein
MVILKRFFIGVSVFVMCFMSVGLIMCGVAALDLPKKIEFFVFIIPVTWVSCTSCYVLINAKC